jgi:hypothetical protein
MKVSYTSFEARLHISTDRTVPRVLVVSGNRNPFNVGIITDKEARTMNVGVEFFML